MLRSKHKNPYELLEEARTSWDYFISDEVVYERKIVKVQRVENPSWINSYLKGDIWFEVIANVGNKLGFAFLIEVSDDTKVITGMPNMRSDVLWRNDAMFVQVRKKFQISSRVFPKMFRRCKAVEA